MGYYGGGIGEPGSIQAAHDKEQRERMSPVEYDRAIRDEQQKQRQQAIMTEQAIHADPTHLTERCRICQEQARYPDAADSILRHAAISGNKTDAICGPHYRTGGVEAIDLIDAACLGYYEGNIVKYVVRWREKGGLADLEKAKWYLERLLRRGAGEIAAHSEVSGLP